MQQIAAGRLAPKARSGEDHKMNGCCSDSDVTILLRTEDDAHRSATSRYPRFARCEYALSWEPSRDVPCGMMRRRIPECQDLKLLCTAAPGTLSRSLHPEYC